MMHESGSRLYFCVRILARSCCFQSVYAENYFDARSPWMLGDWNGQRTAQQQGYTSEMSALLDAKHAFSRGTEYADQFAFGAHLDLEKILGWRSLLSQTSDALSGHLSSAQEVWGRGQTWRLPDFWIKKKFLDQKLEIKAGRFGEGEDISSFDCGLQNLALCGSQAGNWVSGHSSFGTKMGDALPDQQ